MIGIDVTICVLTKYIDSDRMEHSLPSTNFALELSTKLCALGFDAITIIDYPNTTGLQNILLIDATFESESFGNVDLSCPVLKILTSYPDFRSIDFHDFVVYPFQDMELVSRITNLYNMYQNIQYFNQVNNNFKSYLLNLSHDVYSPVKLIKSQIEYLRANSKNEYYDTIFDATLSQLLSIINVLLSVPYSSVASDSIAIDDNSQSCNFAFLIENIATQFNLYASAQGVDIVVYIEEQVKDACIASNYTYLWRMVYNLVFNAIKYCLGGGTIKLVLSKVEDNLRFEIIDTGIGMIPEQLISVRKYLRRANESHEKFGLGRGLAVVKFVLNSLAASVAVDSELGVGTTFIIDFPTVKF